MGGEFTWPFTQLVTKTFIILFQDVFQIYVTVIARDQRSLFAVSIFCKKNFCFQYDALLSFIKIKHYKFLFEDSSTLSSKWRHIELLQIRD
jgi:hypothetical protein